MSSYDVRNAAQIAVDELLVKYKRRLRDLESTAERYREDEEVLKLADDEERIIITNDKDFGELYFLQHKAKNGILLLRFANEKTANKISALNEVIKKFENKLRHSFIVVSENKIRIRSLP